MYVESEERESEKSGNGARASNGTTDVAQRSADPLGVRRPARSVIGPCRLSAVHGRRIFMEKSAETQRFVAVRNLARAPTVVAGRRKVGVRD